jgi:hypothetical protein
MKRPVLSAVVISFLLVWLQASDAGQMGMGKPRSPAEVSLRAPRLDADFAKLPLQFIPNEGQVAGPAAFYVHGRDKTIYFAAEGLTFVLDEGSGPERWVVKLDFVGANPKAAPASLESSGAVFSYFKGRTGEWRPGLRASSRIIYRDLWPGIDLVYDGTVDRLKSAFVVNPGADPSKIRFAYRGAESVTLTDEGRLAVATPAGGFEDDLPVAWQETEGAKAAVDAAYHLDHEGGGGKGGGGSLSYGFDIGAYDPSLPLVIDPAVLVYCGFIGGAIWDIGNGVAVDASGCAYVTGTAQSQENTFPVKVGPDLTYNGGTEDIFVAKVSADGSELVYCGYIGGLGYDNGSAIAVDSAGCAYVSGRTTSADFPVTPGSSLVQGGGEDAIVAKVNASGTGLDYVGCIAGSADELAFGIAVDGAGCAYVVGRAINFLPVKIGPDLTRNSSYEAFIAKVNAAGTDLVYCGYIGGNFNEEAYAVAVDAAGNAYVAGRTNSSDFPFKGGPGSTINGDFDGFVAKVKADGTGLDYSGYIGGRYDEDCRGIAVDAAGNAYVTGYTESDETTFRLKVGPDLSWNGGYRDAFVARLNPDGTLGYCGHIGGEDNDSGLGIAVDGAGNAYVIGTTASPETTFPVREGPDVTWNGSADDFVAKVNPAGTGLVYCGYVGGNKSEEPSAGIAVDGEGNAYIAGTTFSRDPSFPVLVGPDLTANGAWPNDEEAFVAKLSAFDIPAASTSSVSPASATAGDPALAVSVGGTDFEPGSVVMWDGSDLPTTFLSDQGLRAEVGADILQIVGIVAVTVRNPNGGVSNAVLFTVNNTPPVLTSLSPASAVIGSSGFNLTLYGTGFVPGAVALWDGQSRTTTCVSGTELQAAIAAEDIEGAGRIPVTVVNPAPGGGSSATVDFSVVTFSVDASPVSVTVTAGSSAVYAVGVTPQFGSFDSTVSLSCTGLPRGCTYLFSPASVTPGANQASTVLTLKTTARKDSGGGAALAASALIPPVMGLFILAFAVGWLCYFLGRIHAKPFKRWATAVILIGVTILIAGCSAGGGNPPLADGTPAGTFQITVQAASGSLVMTTPVTLVVR